MAHLIIKHHRPYQIVAGAIALTLLISTSFWLLLDESHWALIKSRISLGQESKRLWTENRNLMEENRQLREQVVMLERTTQIDSQAAAEFHEEMKQLQNEIYNLRGELDFYQAIMASTGSTQGLSIQGMRVERLPQNDNYRFKLILTHVGKSDKVAEGTVEIVLEGLQDGVARSLTMAELGINPVVDMSFNFKNFKRIEGNMMLPGGFSPHRVVIRLQPKDMNLSKIKRIFDWSEVLG